MASSLLRATVKTPADYTTREDYRIFIESMIPNLIRDGETRQIPVSPESGYLYRGNLTAFLLDNQVPLEDHFVVMLMNGITNPIEFNESAEFVLVPGVSTMGRLKQLYRTKL